MALPAREQLKYWSIAAIVFAVVLWFLGDVLLPFVLGGAIAYFLDPVADRLERMGFSRIMATAIITVIGVLAFILLLLWVIPSLVKQALDLFEIAPTLFTNLRDFLIERFPDLMDTESPLRQSLISIGETIKARGGELLN
ncbi:MAG: AI-2E family transporter, partial [Marivita sp.]